MNAIVTGSISSIAQQTGRSVAESFISADIITICDTSGSMATEDSRGGRSRYDVMLEELASIQSTLPGKIAIISFSSEAIFCPGGQPVNLCGGTDLARALKFAKVADLSGMRFIVISDGQPDDEGEALKVAKTYKAHIDVIYCGPEGNASGRKFLERLAKASGGQLVTAARAVELAASVERLLLSQ